MRRQEMDIEECVRLLRDRARQFDRWYSGMIVDYIVRNIPHEQIRVYSTASDEKLHSLFVEAKSSAVAAHGRQFHQGPFPLVHWKRHFDPCGNILGFQCPCHPIYPQRPYQFHPSGNFQGIQAQTPPTGPSPTGAFQSPFSETIGLGQRSKSVSDNVMASNHRSKGKYVTGYPPSSSKVQTKRCEFYFSSGCKQGLDCYFSHVTGAHDKHSERQVSYLKSLHMLEMDIREFLLSQQSPVLIEHLPNMYFEMYGKPLNLDGLLSEVQRNGITYLLLKLDTVRVIERQGRCYIILAENASKYLDSPADGFKLVVPSEGSYRIYITMAPGSTFTEEDVYNYFSNYGSVEDVRIPPREKRMFGYVQFSDPGTVKQILSERSPSTPHFISGGHVFAKLYNEKPAERFALKDVNSDYSMCKVSDSNDSHEHRTGEKTLSSSGLFQGNLSSRHDVGIFPGKISITGTPEMASQPTHNMSLRPMNDTGSPGGGNIEESLHLSNPLDEASADQDRGDRPGEP